MPKDRHIAPTSSGKTVPPRSVVFLAYPGMLLLDLAGPMQVFASANESAVTGMRGGVYDIRVVGPVERISAGGLPLTAASLAAADGPIDTLIVPGGASAEGLGNDGPLMGWLTEAARRSRRVASVCTGAFLLASAGLLDGRRATTHWSRGHALASAFPSIHVETDSIFIKDGSIWTSAGISAGIDLALALVEEDLGRGAALALARHLVVFLKRPGGQAQFSTALTLAEGGDRFDRLHDWMQDNLSADLSVSALAAQAGMSQRSFQRHYRRLTGIGPAQAVERFRVEAARQILGMSDRPLKRVARDCGFGSEATMRRSFLRILGISPNAYRTRFPV